MADSKSFFFGSASETTSFNPGSFKYKSSRSPSTKRRQRSFKNCKSAAFFTTPSLTTPSTASSNNNNGSTTNGSVFNLGACEYQLSTPSIAIVNPLMAQNSATALEFSVSTGKSVANSFVFGHATSSVEINQKKATEEANQEPVLLPLTMISRILNGIPQNPHFYQLRNYSELVRKNLISSWDCTFEETVLQLHSLQTVDFCVKASELWKTMGELQSLGYNVILLRRRLVELSDVMMELKMSQMEIKRLKIKAENRRMKKSRIGSVILNLQEMAKREQESMERVLVEVTKMESELPKFDGVFAKLTLEPL